MKQQIFVIHGGDAFETYEEYLVYLRNKEVTLARMRHRGWKMTLGEQLGDGFDVYNPSMPNSWNARYAEWKIIFDKIVALMEPGVILVGHSLGGIFLAKYLSEQNIQVPISATLLVAAPFNTESEHPLVDFILSNDLRLFAKQGGEIRVYHSKDDDIVPFSNAEAYLRALPRARLVTFTDRGHFHAEAFPEIVDDIRTIAQSSL